MKQVDILVAYISTGAGRGTPLLDIINEDNPLVIILNLVVIVILGFIFYKVLDGENKA